MGGGSLMTPLLILVFGFNPTVAVGTDLFHGAIFKTVGAIRHRQMGNVQARLSGWMFIGSAPMSLLGVAAATWIGRHYPGVHSVQTTILGAALLLGGLGTFAKALIRYREHPDGAFKLTTRDRLAALAIGAGGGFVVGLTSVGSGVFFGLTLLIVFPLRSAKVIGTDVFHAAALLWVAGFGHLVAGNVDMHAVLWLLIGSVPGVLIGSPLATMLPDRSLRLLLATILVVSGVKLTAVTGANWIAAGSLIAISLLIVGTLLRRALRPSPTLPPPQPQQ
jgi:uncharacterized protein